MYLLGIDIGTSYWKAVLYTVSGRAVAETVCPAKIHRSGFDYFDPEELWKSVTVLIEGVTGNIDPGRIKGIAFTGMAEAGVPLDSSGKPLFPIITWYDRCTLDMPEWSEERVDYRKVHNITGLFVKHIYSASKLAWLGRAAAIRKKIHKWLCIPDYLVYRLTGEYSMDYSIASRTMLLDLRKRTWSPTMLEYAGIEEDIMPPLYPAGAPVGRVSAKAARATGLSRETIVSTGGHDHVCGAFAVGAVEGVLLDSIGTAESLFTTMSKPVLNKRVFDSRFSSGCHVQPGKYYMMGGIYTAGAVIDWVMSLFDEKAPSKEEKIKLFNKIIEEALKSSDSEVILKPYFRGSGPPEVDYGRKGSIHGLDLSVGKNDIVAAAVKGLCCESRRFAEAIQDCLPGKLRKYRVIGSLAGIKPWMQLKADIHGRPVEAVRLREACSFGAAILAGVGAGVFSMKDFRKRVKYRSSIIKPHKASVKKAGEYYARYLNI